MKYDENPEFIALLKQSIILRTITGSTAHGLNTKNSDIDEKSIVILPTEHLFILGEPFETLTTHKPDHEYHSLRKFMYLANRQNPTILGILNTEERFILEMTSIGKRLRENADLFFSQDVYKTFGGYARMQLMRIKTGLNRATLEDNLQHLTETLNNLIDSFAEKYPIVSDGLLEVSNIDFNNDGKYDIDLNIKYNNIPVHQLYSMLSELANTSKTYNKMNSRNRKPEDKLEKHAMQLMLLLIQGAELLLEGKLNVFRDKDREFLLGFRYGKYTWSVFFDMVKEYELKLTEAFKKTVLPPKTDSEKVNKLYKELMMEYLNI